MELKEVAQQTLIWILETVQKWLDVAPQYVVDLVHRYWMFYWFANLFWLLISWAIFAVLIRYGIKWCKECEEYWPACIGFSLIPLIPIVMCTIQMLKAFIVPEIVMIEVLH